MRARGPVTNPTARALASWLCALWGRHEGARGGRLLPGYGASGVGRSFTPDCPPSGRAVGAHYPLAWVQGGAGVGTRVCAFACPAWPGRAGRPPGRVMVRLTFPMAVLGSLFACSAPSGLGLPCLWLLMGFFVSFPLLPLVAPPLCPALRVFRPRVPWALASCPPPFFFPPPPSLSAPLSPALRVFRPGLPSALASCCPPPFFCVLPCAAVLWCPVLIFFFSLLVALVSCCSPLVLGRSWFRVVAVSVTCLCAANMPASLLSVRCSLALAGLAGVLCCCLLCLCVCCWAWLSSVVSWWVLVAPGVVSRWRAVVCPWVLCCVVVLRVVPPGVALSCAVSFRFALFGAAARCVVPRGVVLCVSCRLRPVRCCCVARSPSVPCSSVLCLVVLCCRVVLWCPVLPPCWVCFLRGCGCTYLKNRCNIS